MANEKRYGLALKKGEPERIPVLDLEEAYRNVRDGKSMNEMLKELAEGYVQICSVDRAPDIVLVEADDILSGLHTLVINFEENRDDLRNIPYLKVNDLAVIPMIFMPDGKSLPVSLEAAQSLCESSDLLLAKAMKNHCKVLPPILIPLSGEDISKEDFIHLDNRKAVSNKETIYMLTNEMRVCGAAAIADKDVLAKVSAKLGESFYILPCNINEAAVVPESMGPSMDTLKATMENINKRFGKDGEFLSGNIYLYDSDRGKVIMYDGRFHDEKVQFRSDMDGR